MAKRKTPKIKDLRPEKITDIQLNSVQSCVRTMDQLTMNAGRIEVQKHALLTSLQTIQTDLDNLRGEFIKQYGTDNINIEDGSIVYPEQSNSKEDGEANKKD
tara:strand:+ start:854 stop:1159 length:306 start_codon:yes stop_codon:yes gene_type:complete